MAYFRVAPLGVTSQIGSIARTALSDAGMLTGRLNGLDTFSGCVTAVIHTISDNGLVHLGADGGVARDGDRRSATLRCQG